MEGTRRPRGSGEGLPPRRDGEGLDLKAIIELIAAVAGLAAYVFLLGGIVLWVRLAAAGVPPDTTVIVAEQKRLLVLGLKALLAVSLLFLLACLAAYAIGEVSRRVNARRARRRAAKAASAKAKGEADREVGSRGAREPERKGDSSGERKGASGDDSFGDVAFHGLRVLSIGLVSLFLGAAFAFGLADILDWADDAAQTLVALGVASLVAIPVVSLLYRRLEAPRDRMWVIPALLVLALFLSAPLGVLVAAIAISFRFEERIRTALKRPRSAAEFLTSPFLWAVAGVYTAVALAYVAMPPVPFERAEVTTPTGIVTGGYLARTGEGVYLIQCEPSSESSRDSRNERTRLIPTDQVRHVSLGGEAYVVDNDERPSAVTIALRAVGLDHHVVAGPFGLRPKQRVCGRNEDSPDPDSGAFRGQGSTGGPVIGGGGGDGDDRPPDEEPPPRLPPAPSPPVADPPFEPRPPTTGGPEYTGGPPPTGRSAGGEPTIRETVVARLTRPPLVADLALRFQPTVKVSVLDRFWPTSVATVLASVGRPSEGYGGRYPVTCLVKDGVCLRHPPTLGSLASPTAAKGSYLDFPARVDATDDQFRAWQLGLGVDPGVVAGLERNPVALNPWASAQVYFHYAGTSDYARYYKGAPRGLIALQYWFYYPFNYFPLVVRPGRMLTDPHAAPLRTVGFHEGDWEHVTVLVDRNTYEGRYVWMARHDDEGRLFKWRSGDLRWDDGHVVVYGAYGGHPSYNEGCRAHRRRRTAYVSSDYVVCRPGLFVLRYSTTPLVDLSATPWGCWPGYYGEASRALVEAKGLAPKRVKGPNPPLRQAENVAVCNPGRRAAACDAARADERPLAAEVERLEAAIRKAEGAPERGLEQTLSERRTKLQDARAVVAGLCTARA